MTYDFQKDWCEYFIFGGLFAAAAAALSLNNNFDLYLPLSFADILLNRIISINFEAFSEATLIN